MGKNNKLENMSALYRHCAAVRLMSCADTLVTPDPENVRTTFDFSILFVIELGARGRQTYGRTDGPDP